MLFYTAAAITIKLTLAVTVCKAPCTMRAVIEFGAEVREGQAVCIKLDNGHTRISCWRHHGERIQDFQIRDIPAGTYMIEAAVRQGRDTAVLEVR